MYKYVLLIVIFNSNIYYVYMCVFVCSSSSSSTLIYSQKIQFSKNCSDVIYIYIILILWRHP